MTRSARWFAPDDLRSFGHRSRAMQIGYDDAHGRQNRDRNPNTWSNISSFHWHLKQRVEEVNEVCCKPAGSR